MVLSDSDRKTNRRRQPKRSKVAIEALRADYDNQGYRTVAPSENCLVVEGDCRSALQFIPDESISCLITSPPYGDQKNYGSDGELGATDATHNDFIQGLNRIMAELYRCAHAGAAMWIVVDTIKRHGTSIPLPWEVIEGAASVGWTFQDVVVWDKGKSLPWSHAGHFRGVCEFVLLFSKGRFRRFNLESVRETGFLSSYWVKYPERYNPMGKAPSDLWHFPIPVQGSWAKSGIRHFCPFPPEMVARMINITTSAGDTVLDPFAGTCTVPAVAAALGRTAVGIEINSSFVSEFKKDGYNAITTSLGVGSQFGPDHSLADLILGLRMLKLPRSLFVGLSRPDRIGPNATDLIAGMIVHASLPLTRPRSRAKAKLRILLRDSASKHLIDQQVQRLMEVPPLSKFGINVEVVTAGPTEWIRGVAKSIKADIEWYRYDNGMFNAYTKAIASDAVVDTLRQLSECQTKKYPPVFSNLGLSVTPPVGN